MHTMEKFSYCSSYGPKEQIGEILFETIFLALELVVIPQTDVVAIFNIGLGGEI